MIPPKYKFYIGYLTGDAVTITKGYGWHTSTGEPYENSDYWSTKDLVELKGTCLYMNHKAEGSTNSAVLWFDTNKEYLGYAVINTNFPVMLPLDGAKYFALRFYVNDAVWPFIELRQSPSIYYTKEVVAHYKTLKKKFKQENDQIFFRETLDGTISVFGNDYEFITEQDIDSKFLFIITKKDSVSSDSYSFYHRSTFSKTDCKIDHSKKKVQLKLDAEDDYTDILNKYEETVDIVKEAVERTAINYALRPVIQVYVRGSNTVTNIINGAVYDSECDTIDENSELRDTWHFFRVKNLNEFYIQGTDTDLDGIYTGPNKAEELDNGYYLEWVNDTNKKYRLCIFVPYSTNIPCEFQIFPIDSRDILYVSTVSHYTENHDTQDDNFYISDSSLTMNRASAAPSDWPSTFTIDTIFDYHVYLRILTDNADFTSADLNTVEPDDPFINNDGLRNYHYSFQSDVGTILINGGSSEEPTEYGMTDYSTYFCLPSSSSAYGFGRFYPVGKSQWANASLWYYLGSDTWFSIIEPEIRTKETLRDGINIGHAIKKILEKLDIPLEHEPTEEYSRFLYGDTNIGNFAKFYVFITPKSNMMKANYDQAAQTAETSLKELLEMLRDCFRCYWFIEDGKLKIERIDYFLNGMSYTAAHEIQLDFTQLVDQFNKIHTRYFQSEVEYDKSDLSRCYEFEWSDDTTEVFGPAKISTDANYVQQDKTESISLGSFCPDVDLLLAHPDDFSQDGFALLCPVKYNDEYTLPIIETTIFEHDGLQYEATVQNWYASWFYLIRFYALNLPSNQYTVDGISSGSSYLNISSIMRCMSHEIEFPWADDLDTMKLITTQLGDGQIDEMSVNIDTRLTTITLKYVPS